MIQTLHRNQGQVAMGRNLSQSPYRNVVQGTLTLEPRERTLYGSPLGILFVGILKPGWPQSNLSSLVLLP